MSKPTKQYLGDGVYADFDGIHVVLTTEDGIRATNTIFLDHQVVEGLNKYVENLKQRMRKETSCPT